MLRSVRDRVGAPRSIGLVGCALFLTGACVPGGEEPAGSGVGTPPPPVTAPPVTGGAIMVRAQPVAGLGSVLAGPDGRSVYLFEEDRDGQPRCLDACAEDWPPLTTTDPPAAGPDVAPDLLGTVVRPDGATQVVYNGHPLYYYVGDDVPGQANGHGVLSSGGYWYAVSPAGEPLPTGG
ncbi:COG4315 family predicted lipoprotein [Saccharopolyspora hordei]|uniref:Putative lipoprotein with Yx(FWY)xxD motif n=1 Tax=Saccharopolyspora hordei TaxID=1838 RepID=A0A853AKK7_9PSEU|nr:hypothetical protein [Saccharopolyspora hordei]NYI85224.1 putative lipoprotein with Yx(FWY)xxD motif [Saccharopolyspora hordei]